jgi:hypothetical protein
MPDPLSTFDDLTYIIYTGFALLLEFLENPGILKISSRALENSLKFFFFTSTSGKLLNSRCII